MFIHGFFSSFQVSLSRILRRPALPKSNSRQTMGCLEMSDIKIVVVSERRAIEVSSAEQRPTLSQWMRLP